MDPNSIMRDPRSGDDALLRAASQLRDAAPQLWTGIANDASYPAFHRDVAIHALFKHLARPATLGEAAALLAGGQWLDDAAVERIDAMGGEIPVTVPQGGAAYVIRFPKAAQADMGVYLALDRKLEAASLRDALMSRNDDANLRTVRIVDFALFPADLVP